jgi:hypothetical protein
MVTQELSHFLLLIALNGLPVDLFPLIIFLQDIMSGSGIYAELSGGHLSGYAHALQFCSALSPSAPHPQFFFHTLPSSFLKIFNIYILW